MGRLGHVGHSTELRRKLFPNGFSAEVMQLIHETWVAFARDRSLRLEERITAVFRDALIDAYDAAGRDWFITLEDPITDPTYGTELGRNDMNFFPPAHQRHRQSVFFTLECKRLHVLRPPTARAILIAEQNGRTARSTTEYLAGEYVTDGMQRFVDGQYSSGLPCGGMVGYVLDNDVEGAFCRVRDNIDARRTRLGMSRRHLILPPSQVLPQCPNSVDTRHSRSDGDFVLHHLLVGIAS